ncbi:MSMEG_1061 family FMN-dependent PPOX-type flavoprotein [Vibrio spartinae]|uniref:Pyridoxamine 5'-phosphate oxidase n=1 Tax=Vibrio spartinae TaxID=1918945 RepID=A0A1N6M3T5_9VIBR|nr:MSMEG_1061 family FMN-dependent PPOX-type flavoprotein [Vibrio spartinae]QMV14585.1 pyridoxamine 5'-phosphate oxidase, FMN-binding family [Vibrio spartinae]SIO94075.1 Pyridoxamine 5'-phosphate oxidase [Vibrio spartinae]
MTQITTLEQLRALYSTPHPLAVAKEIQHIDQHSRTFIENSRLFLLASTNQDGSLDVSPRGGEAGFVQVLDDKTLVFPDSPGNNRLDTLTNLITNPKVGLLFMVSGIEDVVRVKGMASIHIDDEIRDFCLDGKTKPKLVIKVTVDSLFFHCPKALMKSKIWRSESYINRDFLPSLGKIIQDQKAEKEQRGDD